MTKEKREWIMNELLDKETNELIKKMKTTPASKLLDEIEKELDAQLTEMGESNQ